MIKVVGAGFVIAIKLIRKIPAVVTVHQINGEMQNLFAGFRSFIMRMRLIAVGNPMQPKDIPKHEKMVSTEMVSELKTLGINFTEE